MAVDTLIGADRIGFCAANDFEKLPLALKIGAVAFRDTPSVAVFSVTIDLDVFHSHVEQVAFLRIVAIFVANTQGTCEKWLFYWFSIKTWRRAGAPHYQKTVK